MGYDINPPPSPYILMRIAFLQLFVSVLCFTCVELWAGWKNMDLKQVLTFTLDLNLRMDMITAVEGRNNKFMVSTTMNLLYTRE